MESKKERLDTTLLKRGLVESRERARRLILAGQVLVKGIPQPKPGMQVRPDVEISMKESRQKYVSRGGFKLDAALNRFGINPAGCVCMDVGASTGGFTDCLLQRGAIKVYAIDVGYGQLHYRLRNDPRVLLRERVNARLLSEKEVPEPVDLAVIDVSFISLKLILPAVARFLAQGGVVISLIKPQFEAGRKKVPRGGVVKDKDVHRQVLERMLGDFRRMGWLILGLMPSPIVGASGNREYLAYIKRPSPFETASPTDINIDSILNESSDIS